MGDEGVNNADLANLLVQQMIRTGKILADAKRYLPEMVYDEVLLEHEIPERFAVETMAMFRRTQN